MIGKLNRHCGSGLGWGGGGGGVAATLPELSEWTINVVVEF